MANKAFDSTDSQLKSEEKPLKASDVKSRIAAADPLRWWELAPGYGYDPYLVQFISHSGNNLTFRFVNCETGDPCGKEHTIRTSDVKLVHSEIPSTLPTASDYTAKRTYGFLMLNPLELDKADLFADAILSGSESMTASGKWPGTAAEPAKYLVLKKENRGLKAEVGELQVTNARLRNSLSELSNNPGVPADARIRLREILDQ